MKRILASVALAAILAAPAFAQQPPTDTVPSSSVTAEGSVRVEGVAPDKVLGAIDTKELVDGATSTAAQPPQPKTQVTVETKVDETSTATIETKTEVIEPVSDRPTLDPSNPIAPEVKAVVDGKTRYTTEDIAEAQLAAVLATPASVPTTVITTTTTTPKADQ
jgi:hypothetical protein